MSLMVITIWPPEEDAGIWIYKIEHGIMDVLEGPFATVEDAQERMTEIDAPF